MTLWHKYRRRLIRRTLVVEDLLYVLDGEEVKAAVAGDWR